MANKKPSERIQDIREALMKLDPQSSSKVTADYEIEAILKYFDELIPRLEASISDAKFYRPNQ